MVDEIMDEAAAGKYIGGNENPILPKTMQAWRLRGVGPKFIKVGRLVRYRVAELESYLERQGRTSTTGSSV